MAQQTREHCMLTLTIDVTEDFPKIGSKMLSVGCVKSFMYATRTKEQGVDWLNVIVKCWDVAGLDRNRKVTCIFRIQSSKRDDFTWKRYGEFSGFWWAKKPINIKDILTPSNGYLKGDKITVVCNITVIVPACCEAEDGLRGMKRRCTDVKIAMGDSHLYANKGALAVQCGYFDAAFNGDFDDAAKDELRLDDVDADDFAEFLKVVYRGAVNKDNVAAVMPLADRFQATTILQECERVLINDLQSHEAIPILEMCGGLDDLKKQLLEGLSIQDLKELTAADMLSQFGKETVVQLLNEAMRRINDQRA